MTVHNHPPYRPVCNERTTPNGLRGACLNDDGTPKNQASHDLMGRIHAAVHSADPNVRAAAVARLIDDVTAELRGDVELLTGRVEAAEDSENLIRDTLAKRNASHGRLVARLDALRAVRNNWQRMASVMALPNDREIVEAAVADISRVLDNEEATR